MAVKCYIFDMAGTILKDDDIVSEQLASAILSHDCKVSKASLSELMGTTKKEAIENILLTFVDPIHDKFVSNMVEYYNKNTQLMSETLPVFQYLINNGIKIALNTGFPPEIQDAILKKAFGDKLKNWISVYTNPLLAGGGRPYSFMIDYICNQLNFSPRDTIKVGDTKSDIDEGKAANCRLSIGITTGTFTREQLNHTSADMIVDSLWELIAKTRHLW